MRFLVVPILLVGFCAGCFHRKAAEPAAASQTTEPRQHYRKPLTSLGTLFGSLPQAAQNTVRAQAGSAEIVDVVKDSNADRVYYKVYFKDAQNYPPLYVAPDGSVLNPDLTVAMPAPRDASGGISSGPGTIVTLTDLPRNAAKLIQERAPNAAIAQIKKELWGNHVVYIVSFKDEVAYPALYLTANGHTLNPFPK